MENFKYFAFVSYRSSDEKWAKWLQEKIEAYRLPTTVQKMNAALPKSKLRPCFRYHTDIQPNELKTELRNKLEQSKYLLVICTPRSAKSPWVGNEIDTFVELGRRDRIIPVIVEGTPYSGNEETECFNPALLRHFPHSDNIAEDREILGVNIHEEGRGSAWMKRERAVIQIVSRMLNVNYDQLWNRQRRRLRQRIVMLCIASLLVIAAIIAAWRISQRVSQPIDMPVTLVEATQPNDNLPPLHDAVLTLYLPDEVKSDTLATIGDCAQFVHIPSHLQGEQVRLTFTAYAYLPVDTMITVSSETFNLPIRRDEALYGHVSAYVLREEELLPNYSLSVAGYTVQTDATGRFTLDIPLAEQRIVYLINNTDTIYLPCGENDVVELK